MPYPQAGEAYVRPITDDDLNLDIDAPAIRDEDTIVTDEYALDIFRGLGRAVTKEGEGEDSPEVPSQKQQLDSIGSTEEDKDGYDDP